MCDEPAFKLEPSSHSDKTGGKTEETVIEVSQNQVDTSGKARRDPGLDTSRIRHCLCMGG